MVTATPENLPCVKWDVYVHGGLLRVGKVYHYPWMDPLHPQKKGYNYISEWRESSTGEWQNARWYNGIDTVRTCMEEKTILCGHWHTSYGHWKYEGKRTEFGPDADLSPYKAPSIVALYVCTAFSRQANVIVLED